MSIAIGFLTFILILIALFLVLLVLVQLPKKDAGVGMAFGAGMSEMLLGAGSGNVLTRITKYTVGIFLGLSLLLSILLSSHNRSSGLNVTRALEEKARASQAPVTTPTTPATGGGLQPLLTPTDLPPAAGILSTTVVNTPTAPAAPTATTESNTAIPAPSPTSPATNPPPGN